MSSWGKAIGLGFLAWLLPFVVAFLAFGLHQSARPVFESVMAVTVTGTAVALGIVYFRGVRGTGPGEGLLLGFVWLAMCILIDAPLMLFGGPMQMSLAMYFGDIGLTYVAIPLVTWGLGVAWAAGARGVR